MTVRAVHGRDAPAWLSMRTRLWPHADAREMAGEVTAFLDGAGGMLDAVFLAEDDAGEPLGFLELSLRPFSDGCDSMPVPHVEGWYVDPGVRGRGVGRALLSAAESWARERGYSEIASDTELENREAQRVHDACGFTETDRLVKYRKKL